MVGLPDGSHFWPYSKLFNTNRERMQCVISGLACLFCAVVSLLVKKICEEYIENTLQK